MAGSGAGLYGVDDELVSELAGQHLVAGLHDGSCHVAGADGPPAGLIVSEQAQVVVNLGRGALDKGHRPDKGRVRAQAGNGEVVDGPLRLCPPISSGGHAHLAQRVFLNAKFIRHGGSSGKQKTELTNR